MTVDSDDPATAANEAFAFDHYDLAPEAACYSLGRLLRRFEWHHEQAVVLAAQRICEVTIPQPEWREPIQKEDLEEAEKEHKQEWSDYQRDKKLLAALHKAIEKEFCELLLLGDRVADQIQMILLCPSAELPDFTNDAFATLRESLNCKADFDTRALEAKELMRAIRGFQGDQNSDELRRSLLEEFVRQNSTGYFTGFRKSLSTALGPELIPYLRLGGHLEELLCPREAFQQMLPDIHEFDGEYINAAKAFVIGFRSFSPGSLIPAKDTLISIRRDLNNANINYESVRNLLEPDCPTAKSIAAEKPRADRSTQRAANTRTSSHSPEKAKEPVVPPKFHCRRPPDAKIVSRIAELHAFVAASIQSFEKKEQVNSHLYYSPKTEGEPTLANPSPTIAHRSVDEGNEEPKTETNNRAAASSAVNETAIRENNSPEMLASFNGADFASATDILVKYCPQEIRLTHKQLRAFLAANPAIRTQRPVNKDGQERKNRLLVHLGDWTKHKDAITKWWKTRRERGGRADM